MWVVVVVVVVVDDDFDDDDDDDDDDDPCLLTCYVWMSRVKSVSVPIAMITSCQTNDGVRKENYMYR